LSGTPVLIDITEVQVVGRYVLRLCFEDGTTGDVDVAKLVDFRGVFSPLADDSEFARLRINPELGTVTWPCGADLSESPTRSGSMDIWTPTLAGATANEFIACSPRCAIA
jgi:hypothetical protein